MSIWMNIPVWQYLSNKSHLKSVCRVGVTEARKPADREVGGSSLSLNVKNFEVNKVLYDISKLFVSFWISMPINILSGTTKEYQ